MSAQLVYDLVPLGSIVTWSDGTPRPPERHRRKLAAWESRNSGGRLIRKQPERRVGTTTLPASITLHKGDYGSQGTIVLRVHQTFSVDSDMKFVVTKRPAIGSVLVLDRAGEDAELVHLASHRADAEDWLMRHGHPDAVLQEVSGRPGCGRYHRGEGGMTAPTDNHGTNDTPAITGVSFGRSADGMPVALVGKHAFACVPGRHGEHYLVSGWRISGPMAEWTRSDFYGHAGELADEDTFRAKVLEQAEHQWEKAAFGRRDIRSAAHTPWGPSQGATIFADGVVCHSTAGHGGFHLAPERNEKVHKLLRTADGFYEEDECWAIVAFTFPDLFTAFERRSAERTMKDSFPDAWEAITGNVLEKGESRKKDERAFYAKHAGDWIVVSAIVSDHEKGFVECIATPGGRRGVSAEERRFLVPAHEYQVGRFGFVIDPERHRDYCGPSSFVGWSWRTAP